MSKLKEQAVQILYTNLVQEKVYFPSNQEYLKKELDRMVSNLSEKRLRGIINGN